MKTKVFNDVTYYILKDDNNILDEMDISKKLTEYFDDFEKKLYDAGLQDIINEIQSQVDKHFKQ